MRLATVLRSFLLVAALTAVAEGGAHRKPRPGGNGNTPSTRPAASPTALKFRVINRAIADLVAKLIPAADLTLDSARAATHVAFDPDYSDLDKEQLRVAAQIKFKTTQWNPGQVSIFNIGAQIRVTPGDAAPDANATIAIKANVMAQTNALALIHWAATLLRSAGHPDDANYAIAIETALTDLSSSTSIPDIKDDLDAIKTAILTYDPSDDFKSAVEGIELDLSADQRTISIAWDLENTLNDPDQFQTALIAIQMTKASVTVGAEFDMIETQDLVSQIQTGMHAALQPLQAQTPPAGTDAETALSGGLGFLKSLIGGDDSDAGN